MGNNDAAEMLLAAQAECLRLEQLLASHSIDPNGNPIAWPAGAEAIAAERIRQIETEGYAAEQDAGREVELAQASYCYAQLAATQMHYGDVPISPTVLDTPPQSWPWLYGDWKPDPDPTRNLAKAGALAAAAIDARKATAAKQLDEPSYDEGSIGDE